jgi:hypothetical protein
LVKGNRGILNFEFNNIVSRKCFVAGLRHLSLFSNQGCSWSRMQGVIGVSRTMNC